MCGFERLVYGSMAVLPLSLIVFFSLSGICVGLFCIFRPALTIELQKRFYGRINWRMEPISMEKELRNPRLMGWFLILVSLAMLFLITRQPCLLRS